MKNPALVAVSRQNVLQRQMDVIADNLANAQTTGFKAETLSFAEHLHKKTNPNEVSFVKIKAHKKDFSQGSLHYTSNQTDMAIQGDGFFKIQHPDGIRYTRAGAFQMSPTGQLVNLEGYPVLDAGNGPVNLPPNVTSFQVSASGEVITPNGVAGKIGLAKFEDSQKLERVGGNLYKTDAQPQNADKAFIIQGAIEESNVKPVLVITEMIEVLRNYQTTQQLIDEESERRKGVIDHMIKLA